MIFPAPEDMILLLLRLKRLGLRNLIGEPITESTFFGEGCIGVVVVMEVEVKVADAVEVAADAEALAAVGPTVSNRKTEVCGELKVTGLNFCTCIEEDEGEAKNGETNFLEQAFSKLDADFLLASVVIVSAEQEIIESRFLVDARSDLLDLGERRLEEGFEMSEVLVVALLVAEEEAEICRASASWV
mgnify:CR=1 FL=1